MKRNILLLFTMLLSFTHLYATKVYVKSDGDNTNDGTTLATAVADLNTAYDLSSNEDSIIVDGALMHTQAFTIEKNLYIIGQNDAVIDAAGATKFFNYNNTVEGAFLEVKNITFRNGNGLFIDQEQDGGAVLIEGTGSVTIEQCIFENNTTTADGGAIAVAIEGKASIVSCHLIGNEGFGGKSNGGALVAGNGGNTSTLNIYETLIKDNKCDRHGGAIFLNGKVFSHLRNTTIYGNRAALHAGAINVVSEEISSTRFDNVTITANGNVKSVTNGGGLKSTNFNHDFIINNSIIFGNVSKVDADGNGDPSDINFIDYNKVEINSSIIGYFVSGMTEDVVTDNRVLYGGEGLDTPQLLLNEIDERGVVTFEASSLAAGYGDPSLYLPHEEHDYIIDQLGMLRSKLSTSIDLGAYQLDGKVSIEQIMNDTNAPEVPENIRFSEVLDIALELEWDASIDDGGIEYYTVTIDDQEPIITTLTSYRFTGLQMDTEYKFTIVAYDYSGKSSTPVEILQATEGPIVPLIPYNLKVNNITSTSATISWEIEKHKGLIYEINVFGRWYQTEDLSFDLVGLLPEKEYIVEVRSITKEDQLSSEYSEIFTFTTSSGIIASLSDDGISINAYPNPTFQTMKIELGVNANSYVVYNLLGNIVKESKVLGTSFDLTLPKGMYVIQVNAEGKSLSKKLIFN
ncbi:fibronectin type III domain-containing protein [Flammeovirga sp. EKP202]|uniref:fibronectin type III domain-containing protein n=1 Tax=Flammeovirga sp. EKP202 TaxID=2770592 RepID=UPI00165FFA84|nr:fibronectin type III domain-containing protein [Flammeovirga sp. EKP202]MBD0404309.1 T9SS type A sorting domain-containing protein [Flammeovirga sp. EKP202]